MAIAIFEIPKLLDPIVEGKADYTKGNRLVHPENMKMPRVRRFGNSILTLLTKLASGYWELIDPQNGYTAISKKAMKNIRFDSIYDGYGCPNDILIELNIHNMKVMDIEMPPVYGGGEKSGIKIGRYGLKLSWLLLKGFFRRVNRKYGGLNFHPLWLFYMGGIILTLVGGSLSLYIVFSRLFFGSLASVGTLLMAVLLLLMGLQSFFFAMFFDLEQNKHLGA